MGRLTASDCRWRTKYGLTSHVAHRSCALRACPPFPFSKLTSSLVADPFDTVAMRTTYLASLTLALVGHVAAWGQIGHETVGYIAMEFLGPKTAAFVNKTIPAKYNHSLGPAAPWADSVRHLSEFAWSAPFHFIDANGKQYLVVTLHDK